MTDEPTNVLDAVRAADDGPDERVGVGAADDVTAAPLPAAGRRAGGAHDPLLGFDLDAATIPDLQRRMDEGTLTAVDLTAAYLRRVRSVDALTNALLFVNPRALAEAAASDRRRAAGRGRGPLDGIPFVAKDNIDTKDLPTTAGSRALLESRPARDATVVRRLRQAGMVLVGKANLTEWANFRSPRSTSGWSGVGGVTRHPYALDRNASGSSTGSAVAVAASLAQVAVGTETDGSIVSPAGMCGVVGIKPTLGLVSRAGIVPISLEQDTAGPMARHVVDAALVLAALQGRDGADAATQAIPSGYPRVLLDTDDDATPADRLDGVRLGVWSRAGHCPAADAVFDRAVAVLRRAGAALVDVDIDESLYGPDEGAALVGEFRRDLETYLAATPGDHPRTLKALVAFNAADPVEQHWFGQETFEAALAATRRATTQARRRATTTARRLVDELLIGLDLDAIVAPTNKVPWKTVLGGGDAFGLPHSSSAAAVTGYPSLTVPAGLAEGFPVGVSLIGPPWSEPRLLGLAHAFERLTAARRPPMYRRSS